MQNLIHFISQLIGIQFKSDQLHFIHSTISKIFSEATHTPAHQVIRRNDERFVRFIVFRFATSGQNGGDVFRLAARAESFQFDQPQPVHGQVDDSGDSGGYSEQLERHPSAVASPEDSAAEGAQSAAERVVERTDCSVQRGQCSRWSGRSAEHGTGHAHQVDGHSFQGFKRQAKPRVSISYANFMQMNF